MQTQVPGARADQQCVLDPILLDEIRQVGHSTPPPPTSHQGGVQSSYCDSHNANTVWAGCRGWGREGEGEVRERGWKVWDQLSWSMSFSFQL